MNKLISTIEKMKPAFDVIARNKYIKAIKDGFISAMPIILFSSIFMLLAYIPNIFGYYWPKEIEAMILKPYNYSMGILGLVVAATTAKHLTDSLNRDMPVDNQINNVSTMMAAIIGFLVLGVDSIEGGFSSGFMGSKGLLCSFIVAFVVAHIYKFCIKRNITINMPDSVPPNISQTFKDVIPFAACVLSFTIVDILFRKFVGVCFAQFIIELFQPLFTAADGYLGIAIIYGAMAMFWFVGVHGPAIVEPAVVAIYYVNLANNLELYQAGQHAANILTPVTQQFVATLGGTGATLVVPFMFAFLAKSKELRAIGRASAVPVTFAVNEPLLFGAPMILNPVFFIPFILTPIFNVWIFKFFVEVIGMNAGMYVLPWTTPGPLGLILGCGIGIKVIILAVLLLVVDFIMYYPFFKVYDKQKVDEEKAKNQDAVVEEQKQIEIDNNTLKSKRILVLCAGGGTSGLLANALKKAAEEKDIPLISAAGAYGAHMDIMKDYDLVILAPQVASFYGDLKKDTDRMGIKCVACEGKQYIGLTRNPEEALKFVFEVLEEK